jgi:hypothetical protein
LVPLGALHDIVEHNPEASDQEADAQNPAAPAPNWMRDGTDARAALPAVLTPAESIR